MNTSARIRRWTAGAALVGAWQGYWIAYATAGLSSRRIADESQDLQFGCV